MADQLYQLQTLERVCNHSSTEKSKRDSNARCNPTNVKCAFHQSEESAVSVIVRSDHLVTLIAEKLGKPHQKKSVHWFIDSGKTITCICWIKECLWALLGTTDAFLYILPVLPLVDSDWSQSKFASVTEYPTTDIAPVLLNKQKHTKPLSVACWSSQFLNGDIGVVGTEEGEVVFVDLLSRQELLRVKIGDAVVNLEVVKHGKFLTYLLVSTVTSNQLALLLEQSCSTAGSLSNSMEVEASSLEFTLVRSSDTIMSILDSEASDPSMFRPMRFNQFMRTVQLSVHTVKENAVIVAHCLSSNVVKVYDSSLDNWLPMFVYNIPISTDRILLTDNIMFTLTRASKHQPSSVTILSTKFSEISGKEHSSEAKLQTLSLPHREEIVGIYRQRFCQKKSRKEVEEKAVLKEVSEEDTSGLDDGCIIVGTRGIYQIKPRVNFDDVCFNLITEGNTRKADILGMTLDLNMTSLFLRAAEYKLQQKQLQEAARLYSLSRHSSVVWAYYLAKYGYVQETLSVIEGILNKQGEEGHANCCKLAIVAIKCLILLHQTSKNKSEVQVMLATFLSDNLDYDEVEAIKLLGSHSLWELMFNMAWTRGYLETAMETLFENWPRPLPSFLLAKVTSPDFLDTFVVAKNGLFLDKLPKPDAINVILLRTELVLRHSLFVRQHLHWFSLHQLILLASLLDPTNPKMKDIFEMHRERSASTSSVSSVDKIYKSDIVTSTKPSTVVQLFIYTLIELYSRRVQKDYDVTMEPGFSQRVKPVSTYCNNNLKQSFRDNGVRRNLLSCGRHHVGLVSSGELYTWGKATCGRLGHGSIIPVEGSSPPLRVETLHMHQQLVLSVSCGCEHTMALTSLNRIYAWGSSRFGQLGMGDRKTRTHPSLVEELKGRGCVEVVCGQYHSLARTQQKQVYSWGWGVHGQLGHGSIEDESIPLVISSLVNMNIIQISAGACHSGVLSAEGKVMMFGSGTFGQLGLEGILKTSQPLLLSHLEDQPIRMLACGYYHNLALTASNPQTLYIWGKSPVEIRTQHQVSRKLKKSKRISAEPEILKSHMKPTPVSLKNLSSPIKKMVCSYMHSLLLTEAGKIYSWGRNDMDQLGDPSTNKKYEDTPFVIQPNQKFAEIAIGSDFSAAINHYGVVYSWGSAEAQQLGHTLPNQSVLPGTIVSVPNPRRVPNVPLITIPAQLMQPQSFPEKEDKVHPNQSEEELTETSSGEGSDLPVSFENHPPYDETSLFSVLDDMRGLYQLPVVLKDCKDRELWTLASKIYFIAEDFENVFCCELKAHRQEKPCPTLEDTMAFINSFLKRIPHKMSPDKIHSHQRSLQKILMRIFIFWDEKGYKPTDIELTLSAHLGLLSYPLSILLFSSIETELTAVSEKALLLAKFQSSFSTKFCLDVTAAASNFIQTGKLTVLGDLNMSNIVNNPSATDEAVAESMETLQSSKIQLVPDLIRRNGNFGEKGLEIEPGMSMESERVVFTCNHNYGKSEFNEEVKEAERKLSSYSEMLNMTCAITKGLFQDDTKLMPSACPKCTLNALLPLARC